MMYYKLLNYTNYQITRKYSQQISNTRKKAKESHLSKSLMSLKHSSSRAQGLRSAKRCQLVEKITTLVIEEKRKK